jgi:hypothetical protein
VYLEELSWGKTSNIILAILSPSCMPLIITDLEVAGRRTTARALQFWCNAQNKNIIQKERGDEINFFFILDILHDAPFKATGDGDAISSCMSIATEGAKTERLISR